MNSADQALGNIVGLQQAINNSDFDAILIVSPENLCYAANVQLISQIKIRGRLTIIVWPKGQTPYGQKIRSTCRHSVCSRIVKKLKTPVRAGCWISLSRSRVGRLGGVHQALRLCTLGWRR